MSCATLLLLTIIIVYVSYTFLDNAFSISKWTRVNEAKRETLTYLCREKFSEVWHAVQSEPWDSLTVVRTIDSSSLCDEVFPFSNVREGLRADIGRTHIQKLRDGLPTYVTVERCDAAVNKKQHQITCILNNVYNRYRALRDGSTKKPKDCDDVPEVETLEEGKKVVF